MNTCTASPPCISRFEISRGARDDPERMTYAHWTERRHGRFHASPTNHAIGARMEHGRGRGTIVRISSFLSLSVSFSLETLIGPNSRDQTLFRLFVSRREIDRGRISWLAISWCTKLREADSYRSFTGTSTMLVDYSYTFFYNLSIQNARWSTLRTLERSRV